MIFTQTTRPAADKELCPLGCGRFWHGLPKDPYGSRGFCPSPFGVPVPVVDIDEPEEEWVA